MVKLVDILKEIEDNQSPFGPPHVIDAAKDLAYSMPSHTTPDENGRFSDEKIEKAILKHSPVLKQVIKLGIKDKLIRYISGIVNN
jgi:hypothetical protein